MNYLRELLAFHAACLVSPVSARAMALWYTLMYFSNMAINSKGNYIVTVNDSKTSKTLAFYEIDVENEIVKEK